MDGRLWLGVGLKLREGSALDLLLVFTESARVLLCTLLNHEQLFHAFRCFHFPVCPVREVERGPRGEALNHFLVVADVAAENIGQPLLIRNLYLEIRDPFPERLDHSVAFEQCRLLAPDLLIIDDFGLRRLDAVCSSDIYEIIVERHKRSSTILTSNRAAEEWIPLFDDPILAQSALDRLAHNAYHVVIEGDSYRRRQRPGSNEAGPDQRPKLSSSTPTQKGKKNDA